MSIQLEMSEARLRLGVLKVALSLVMLFALIAVAFTVVAGEGQSIAVNALLVCVAFGFLTNGLLAILRIIDWFEARRFTTTDSVDAPNAPRHDSGAV